MKKRQLLYALLALVITLASASCSRNETADATDLLASVPADASSVVVANLHSLLVKTDCKVDDAKITPSEVVNGAITSISDPKMRQLATAFFNGESGIDPTVALFFSAGYYNYITGFAADPAQFKKTAEKYLEDQFSSQDGIDICKNVAIKDNRFWINVGTGTIDPREVKHFASLSKAQSFLSKDVSESLSMIDNDVEGWANIAASLNLASTGFQERAMIQAGLQTVIEDATDINFGLNMEKGEMTAHAGVLNSKGKPAKFLLTSQKVDVKTLESIGGKAGLLVALGIPHKLIEQLKKDSDSKSASVLGAYLQAVEPVDGTAAIAFDTNTTGFKGVITTNGKSATDLIAALGSMGVQCKINGKEIEISNGSDVTGASEVAEMAKYFKGAIGGAVLTGDDTKGKVPVSTGALKAMSLMLMPESSSIELELKLVSKDSKKNFAVTLLESSK